MSNVGKALVVFITFASVAFMGFAAVTSLGGTDWKQYLSEKNQESNTKTLKDIATEQDAELKRLRAESQEISEALQKAIDDKAADLAGMKAREDTLRSHIEELNKQIVAHTQEAAVTGNDAITVKNDLAARHEEVVHLRNQLKEMRSQIEDARYEMERLEDQVTQAKELLKLAQRRNKRLKSYE